MATTIFGDTMRSFSFFGAAVSLLRQTATSAISAFAAVVATISLTPPAAFAYAKYGSAPSADNAFELHDNPVENNRKIEYPFDVLELPVPIGVHFESPKWPFRAFPFYIFPTINFGFSGFQITLISKKDEKAAGYCCGTGCVSYNSSGRGMAAGLA